MYPRGWLYREALETREDVVAAPFSEKAGSAGSRFIRRNDAANEKQAITRIIQGGTI